MPLNTTITQSPVILFLGAGASVPLGKPVMEKFVTRLIEDTEAGDFANLLSILVSARGHDLESIMGDLETFLSLDYVSSFVFQSKPTFQADWSDAARLRSLIRHSIIREYRTIDVKRTIEVYQPLFDTIFSHVDSAVYCLPVFTTNYDLAIESFCNEQAYPRHYDLIDGMEEWGRETIWTPSEFETLRIRAPMVGETESDDLAKALTVLSKTIDQTFSVGSEPQRRKLVLFKLHGSVNWMRVTSTGKIMQSLPMYDVVDSDEYQNTIIYPAGNKVATSEPYLTAYDYFSRCCEHAKLVIAIGYSFRDYDALVSLLKARRVNDELTLLLLSPDAYKVLESIPDEDRIFWTRAIYGYFGNMDSETKYLPEIDEALRACLKK
ncbi:MAG: SIR2 family protein [Proteobacteria bacterium]|nr:SIR2 family protein [Pseudomonadota bacterium]